LANDGHPPSRPDGTNHGVSKNTATLPSNVKAQTETMWQAAQLRSAGATFREIGTTLDIDPTWARTLVLRALDAAKYEAADLMRIQEGQRLDRMQRSLWQQALGNPEKQLPPDHRAVGLVLRIMDRRARLFGLDAPVRVEVSDEIDRQLEALAAQVAPMMLEGELVYERPDPAP